MYRGAGAYICGEETALLDSLEGRRGQPRPRPPFPPVQGLFNAPTQINNVCTIATVPSILELGPAKFKKIGVESSPGTAIFSISGNVVRPGNYELELGTPMRELIYDFAGGIADGRELKAVIPGGSSVPALSPDQIDVPLDYDSLGALGTFFGAASLIVVDDRCCMVQLALRSTKFYMHESCGKCTPCREGTRWMVQILEKLEAGRGTARGHRPAPLGRLAHPRQVAVRARRLRGVPGRELRREVGRGVRGPRRARPLPVRRRVEPRGDRRAERRPRPPRGARMSVQPQVGL